MGRSLFGTLQSSHGGLVLSHVRQRLGRYRNCINVIYVVINAPWSYDQ